MEVITSEKMILEKVTNIKLNSLSNNISFNKCLEFILKQDFKLNKHITPDTLQVLKNNFKDFKLNFEKNIFTINKKIYKISYQLICEYMIVEHLRINLQANLRKHFFFKNDKKYGNISKNIKVEVNKNTFFDEKNKYRVDLELELPNGYKIVIEINEKAHENEGIKTHDFNRALQILNNDNKIVKFFILREKYIKNKYKNIIHFIKHILIPEISKIELLHDEKSYVVTKLVNLTCNSWKPICELIYDSHLNPNDYIICLNNLNYFFAINFNEEFLEQIQIFISHDDNYSNDDNCLSDDIFSNKNSIKTDLSQNKQNEKKENYYKFINGEIKLSWKGFDLYLFFAYNHVDLKKKKMIFRFRHTILSEFINVLKEQRDNIIKNIESQKIWGNECDYNFV